MYVFAVSKIAAEVDRAFWIVTWVSVVFLVGITLAMIYLVLKYHRSRRDTIEQIHGNMTLEILWSVLPFFLVVYLFFVGYEGFAMMREVPENAMVVEVTGKKWSWSFHYPKTQITSSKLVVPVGIPIKCELTVPKEDVLHSFYLPAFRVKEDCVPGKTDQYLWFLPEEEGLYNIFCAEYCGQSHSKMLSVMEVVSSENFKEWTNKQLEEKNKPVVFDKALDATSEEITSRDGKAVYQTFCVSCHGPEGKGGGTVNARNLTQSEGWKNGQKITDIFRTLTEGLQGTQMASFSNILPWDRFAVAHYVASLGEFERPKVTPEDIEKLRTAYPELEKGGEVQVEPKISLDKAMNLILEESKK